MKELLLFMAILVSFHCFGQDQTNFKVVNKKLVWERVYITQGSGSNSDSSFNREIMDLQRYGARAVNANDLTFLPFSAKIKKEYKENKYKVIVGDFVGFVGLANRPLYYEKVFIRNDRLTTNKRDYRTLFFINKWLTDYFSNPNKNDVNW